MRRGGDRELLAPVGGRGAGGNRHFLGLARGGVVWRGVLLGRPAGAGSLAAHERCGGCGARPGGLLDQLRVSMLMLGTFYPLPTPTGYVPAGVSEYDLANMTTLRAEADKVRQAEMSNFVRQIATELPPAGAGGAAPATPFIATELAAGT